MRVDHVGYAVRRMDRALASFGELGFSFGDVIDDADRNVRLAFGEKDGYRVELVCPLDKATESPVDQYLASAPGVPYHICYRASDLEPEVEALRERGFRVVIPPAPAVAFDGRRVVFLTSLGTGLMEIVEE